MQVVISLTTIPARLGLLEPVIKSLLTQNHTVNQILLNIPTAYKTWPTAVIRDMPKFLNQPRVVVNRQCTDDGPITKLLGFADRYERYNARNTIVIYVDDDHVYPPGFVSAHVRAHQLCASTVFAGRGGVYNGTERVVVSKPWFGLVHTADGVQGVSVRVLNVNWRLLASQARAWIDRDPAAFHSDDMVLSALFWEQGLACRLAPCTVEAVPLKHAGDEFALCTGRNGALDPTTARYVAVQYARKEEWLTPLVHKALIGVQDELLVPVCEVAIAIFAYQRPDLLERVLQSILNNAWFQERQCPVFLFLDGIVHPETGALEGSDKLWLQNQAVFRRLLPHGKLIASPVNQGVAMMQYWALSALASNAAHIIMLEDDLVLGPTYLDTLWTLREVCRGKIGSVQAGYRRESGWPHLIRVTDAAAEHVHYWGWLTTAEAWRKAEPLYTAAVQELFQGRYYRRRDFQQIKEWFQRHGVKDYGRYSQDWVRDACFQMAGMPYKAYTSCRRGVPIGRDGLHSSSALFDRMGLDDREFDVATVPTFNFEKAMLTWDSAMAISVVSPACASVLGRATVIEPTGQTQEPTRWIQDIRQPVKKLLEKLFG